MRVVDFSHGNFLQKKIHQSLDAKEFDITKALSKRYTTAEKGRHRQKKLCPMMEINRREFWEKLPIANVVDLVDGYED